MGLRAGMLGALHLVFPPRCLCCGENVSQEGGFCGICWRDLAMIRGLACDCCGVPLAGEEPSAVLCEECLSAPRPWERGRAAMLYAGTGRRLVLALKYHDRLDLVKPLGAMLLRACQPILEPDMLLAPVPLHRSRLLSRRYNQAALLSRYLARQTRLEHIPDLLTRCRATPPQEGKTALERAQNLAEAIRPTERFRAKIRGRHVLLVDDVLTTGSTLAAATEACLDAGAQKVSVAVLARVARDA